MQNVSCRTIRLFVFKKIPILITFLFYLYSMLSAQDTDPHMTGLIPLTEEDKLWIAAHGDMITRVPLNDLGIERINAVRSKKGLPPIEPANVLQSFKTAEDFSTQEEYLLNPWTEGLDALPVYVDNSTLQYFPPIRTQGGLPSCVPFSICYYQLTYYVAQKMGWDTKNEDNTKKMSPKWVYNVINGGNAGGTSWTAAYRALLNHGCATWDEFPYVGSASPETNYREWCSDPAVWENALQYKAASYPYITNFHRISSLKLVKQLLNNGEIIIFATGVYSWQYKTIQDDPATSYDDTEVGKQCCYYADGYEGSHSMTIVGYNDDIWVDINDNGTIDLGEKGALRIANSWGTGWKDSGLTWISYDALNTISIVPGGPIENRVRPINSGYLLRLKQHPAPRLLAEVTVNHRHRNQITLALGVSDFNHTTPQHTFNPSFLNYSGGAFAFDGTQQAVPFTFIFDMSDLIEKNFIDNSTQKRWYCIFRDTQTGAPLDIQSLKFVDVAAGGTDVPVPGLPQTIDNGEISKDIAYQLGSSTVNYAPVVEAGNDTGINYPDSTVLINGNAMDDGRPLGIPLAIEWQVVSGPGVVTFADASSLNTTAAFTAGGTYVLRLCADDSQLQTHDQLTVTYNNPNAVVTLFRDDFESDQKWLADPHGTDNAITGIWERAVPEHTSYYNVDYQLSTTPSGTHCLVTGPFAGSSAGSYDIDGGVTSITSQPIPLIQSQDISLSFSYYFSHYSNATADDFFRVQVIGATSQTVLTIQGTNSVREAAWGTATADISQFSGQTVTILIEAADGGSGSLVEAAVDDMVITAIGDPCIDPCDIPQNLSVANIQYDGADIFWDPVPNAEYYVVESKHASSNWWSFWIETPYTTTTIIDLNQDNPYDVRVKAVCSDICESEFSPPVQFTTLCNCLVPGNPRAVNIMQTSADITWDFVPAAIGYEYQYRKTTDEWTNWNKSASTIVTITGLSPGTDYEFRVRTNCNTADSDPTKAIRFQTNPLCDCSIPSNVHYTELTPTTVTFVWNSVAEALQYEYQFRVEGSLWVPWAKTDSDTTITITNLHPGVMHEFRVRSNCATCDSDPCSAVPFETPHTPCECPVPQNLTVTAVTPTTATIVWDEVLEAYEYQYQYRNKGGIWSRLMPTDQNAYTVNYLTPGESYEFRVRAVCRDCASEFCDSIGFTTLNYCSSQGQSVNDEWIAQITIGDYTHASDAQPYSDFTTEHVYFTLGETYPLTLTPGFSGSAYSEYWKIWIDLDKDGEFNDTSELVFDAGTTSKTTINGSIMLPLSAGAGQTRMRVSMKYVNSYSSDPANRIPPQPCETFPYGEVEDYTAHLVEPVPDFDPPTPDPMTWAAEPFATSHTTISMTATTADDISGVEYYFECTSGGGHSSGWQSNPTYTDTGLSPETSYSYKVQARDRSVNHNATKWSSTLIAVTDPVPLRYCDSRADSQTYEWVAGVSIGGFSHTSDAQPYSDFTSKIIELGKGQRYSLELVPGFSGASYKEYWKIWIDLNHDGFFDDNGELVFDPGNTGSTPVIDTLHVPQTQYTGKTRMRVAMKYVNENSSVPANRVPPQPCEIFYYGEVEDYTVHLLDTNP